MNLRLAFVVALGASGIVFACSGRSSGGSGPAAGDSQSFINQLCDLYAPCCGKVNQPTDGARCRAFYGAFLGNQQYDGTKGNACLTEVQALSGAPDFCDNAGGKAPSCKKAFKGAGGGAGQPGQDCSKDGDCASSAEGEVSCASSYSSNATTKSCQVQIDGKAGDMPCIYTRDGNSSFSTSFSSDGDGGPTRPAARGYICDLANGVFCNSKTKACAKVQDVGGDCEPYVSEGCVKTAYCSASTKKCVARLAVGEDCSNNSQACALKTNCDPQTRKCIAGLDTGAVCASSSQCASNNCVNGKCDKSGGGDFSTQLLCGGN